MGKKERSPGPAAYSIASTISKSTPAFSFGTMKRPAPAGGPSMSPGPIYQLKASLGRAKDNTFRANPSFGFGTSERPDPGGAGKSNRVPGPGEYQMGTTVGPEKPPTYKSASKFGFGTGSRMPGMPPVPKRLDRSTLEKLSVAPGGAFAGGDMVGALEMPGKDEELGQTPGPGAYDNGFWRKQNPPAFSFGTGSQRPAGNTRATRVPGPGHYKLGTTTGTQTAVILRKSPAVGFGTAKLGAGYRGPEVPGTALQPRVNRAPPPPTDGPWECLPGGGVLSRAASRTSLPEESQCSHSQPSMLARSPTAQALSALAHPSGRAFF